MEDTDSLCPACGVSLIKTLLFCTECGAFLANDDKPIPQDIQLPLSKQNPLLMLERLGGGGAAPLSPDDLIALRYELAEQLDQGELFGAAEAEFDRALEPKLREGKAGERFFRLWLGFWKKLDAGVKSIRQSIADLSHGTGKQPFALAKLQSVFDRELTALIAKMQEEGGDIGTLLTLQLRMQAAWEGLNTILLKIDALRIAENAAAFLEEMKDYDSLVIELISVDDDGLRELWRTYKRFENLYATLHERFAVDEQASDELKRRHAEIVDATVKLIDTKSPVFIKDTEGWTAALTKGWIPSDEKHFRRIMSANAPELREIIESIEDEIADRATTAKGDFNRVVEKRLAEMKETSDVQMAQSRQSEFIRELVTTQQALRQQAEGKFATAWVTAALGAEVGSVMEGLRK